MNAMASFTALFWGLDGKDIVAGIVQPLSQLSYRHFSILNSSDKLALAYFTDFVDSSISSAINPSKIDVNRKLSPGLIEDYPVSSTILLSERSRGSKATSLLIGILVNYALESSEGKLGNQNRVAELSSAIRGLIRGNQPELLTRLASIQSIPELIHKFDDDNASTGRRYTTVFDRIWRSWLSDTLKRWIYHDSFKKPLRKPASSLEKSLRPILDAPIIQIPLFDVADQDDFVDVINLEVPGLAVSEALPDRSRLVRAKALYLDRSSCGDLASNSDAWIPDELITQIAQKSLNRASDALAYKKYEEAERFLAVALGIASGLREIDLSDLIWGNPPCQDSLVLDSQMPIIHRRILHPDNAVNPSLDIKDKLEPNTDIFEWPIPVELHALLCNLKALSGHAGKEVFPSKTSTSTHHYLLREVLKELDPQSTGGMQRIRLALASKLAKQFGSEMAQIVMVDGFSQSVAPAYYSAMPVCQVAEFIKSVQVLWFGSAPYQYQFTSNYIGSRLVLKTESAREWPRSLRDNKRVNRSLMKDSKRQAWVAHRNFLAASLCAATGYRPVNSLGDIHLYDVIADYGLVVLSDKQSDALRTTRIAATGKLWLVGLQHYLQFLQEIAKTESKTSLGKGAKEVLLGEIPLFSVPDENGVMQDFNAAILKQTMPIALNETPNFYRHRLCQFLQAKGIDPELRHAQLGWMVTSAYATADISPMAAKDLADRIGTSIDEFLVHDEWFEPLKVIPKWSWRNTPMPPTPDWADIDRRHQADHQALCTKLKNALREKGIETRNFILPFFEKAIDKSIYELKLDVNATKLERRNAIADTKPIEVKEQQLTRILDWVYDEVGRELTTIERVVAQNTLYQLIKGAMRRGILISPTPHHYRLSPKLTVSPFPLGIGLAVRQAEALRTELLKNALKGSYQEKLAASVLGVMAFSPYRRSEMALQVISKSQSALRSREDKGILRLDIEVGTTRQQIVIAGIAACWLGKLNLRKTDIRVKLETVNQWLVSRRLPVDLNGFDAIDRVESLLMMAGRVELSGIERTLILNNCGTATVMPLRSLANEENWPIETRNTGLGIKPIRKYEQDIAVKSDGSDIEKYLKLTGLLNENTSAGKLSQNTDGNHGWRGKLEQKLLHLIKFLGDQDNVTVLASYVLFRLKYGGARKSKLSRKTLHKELTQFGSALLRSLNGSFIMSKSADELQQIYSEVLVDKTERSRPHVIEEIDRFHRYLVEYHGIPELALSDLYAMAGKRNTSSEPGLYTPNELEQIQEQLVVDLYNERDRLLASPETKRICALRILMFALLEGSGVRPQSVYGLTLGDIKLLGVSRDFIHVRNTGEYGRAKTVTSLGYVPLEGELWAKNREWVFQWIEQEISLIADSSWHKLPLFAIIPSSRNRFNQGLLTQRIDALGKWVTSDLNARTYWLRKNRITQRLRVAASGESPMARDVYVALSASGHSSIDMAIAHYISDPAVYMSHYIIDSTKTRGVNLLAVSGFSKSSMYTMWSRNKCCRVACVLNRLAVPYAKVPIERMSDPPLSRQTESILPKHLDSFARAMVTENTRDQAILKAGLSYEQADALDAVCNQLLLDRGKSIWKLTDPFPRNSRVKPARISGGAESSFANLASIPSADMLLLADAWFEHACIKKIHGSDKVIYLKSPERVEAAKRVLCQNPSLKLCIKSANNAHFIATHDVDKREHSHAAAFEWIMAVLWSYQKYRM
jgi:hypothetical protein